MTSYHRILKLWGRTVNDNTLQCECIHPWQITINGERWSGKIQLIAFIDVVFLISYSQESYFNRGIVIYKNEADRKELWANAGHGTNSNESLSEESLNIVNQVPEQQLIQEKYLEGLNIQLSELKKLEQEALMVADALELKPFSFVSGRSRANYTLTSVGHEIGLQTEYERDAVMNITIVLHKPNDVLLREKLKEAFKQHTGADAVRDAIKLGFVSSTLLVGSGLGHIAGGSAGKAVTKGFQNSISKPAFLSSGSLA